MIYPIPQPIVENGKVNSIPVKFVPVILVISSDFGYVPAYFAIQRVPNEKSHRGVFSWFYLTYDELHKIKDIDGNPDEVGDIWELHKCNYDECVELCKNAVPNTQVKHLNTF